MQVTGTRQQAAWRLRELPPVELVTPGIWSIPVPIPDNPLRYVLSYVFEHDDGVIMVDTGWDHPDAWAALRAGLAAAGIPFSAVTGIVITHVHPDHHGLSRAVRAESGAWIGMHEREDSFLAGYGDGAGFRDRWPRFLRWCGAPPEHLTDLARRRDAATAPGAMARADRLIEPGQLIEAPGLTLRAVWTPGHTPGHLCLHDEARDLLLTGDHVLPRISPNISAYDQTAAPLADYLRSLAALRGLGTREVLPAHEYRFAGLDARLEGLIEHHAARLAEIAAVLDRRPAGQSAWAVAADTTWSRPWAELAGFPRQAALGEVVAHLRHLQAQGRAAVAEADGIALWRPPSATSA
jgi:glyoxylase-like metal-dependent hydrolase (beta-lactamase superfamily II)